MFGVLLFFMQSDTFNGPVRTHRFFDLRWARLLAVTAALIGLSAQARGSIFPAFDFSDWCKYELSKKAFAPNDFLTCVAAEQQAFTELEANYRSIDDASASSCENAMRKATAGHGSYAVLRTCLKRQHAY